jgi:hypothetical protein
VTRRMPAETPAWRAKFDLGHWQAQALQDPSAVFKHPRVGWIALDLKGAEADRPAGRIRRKQN